jgi:DKNYY family
VIINSDLAKDGGAVYCQDRKVSDDPAHFEILRFTPGDRNLDYAKDIHTIYYRCDPIPGADAPTFRRLNDSVFNYAVDDRRAYYQDRVIAGADPATFRVLFDTANEGCAADAQHAYRWDTVIPNVDPRDFPPGKPVTGCDATQVTFGP